jgi:hypothetical protein
MQDRSKIIVAGGFIGLAAAGMLALPGILPPAMADDEPVRTLLKTGNEIFRRPLVASDFVKPDEFIYEPWVSTDVTSQRTVRKIAYGRTTFVDIATTPTGTYSSDGLASPHVRYPGIHPNPEFAAWQNSQVIAVWNGKGWAEFATGTARSFVLVVPIGGSGCAEVGETVYC